MRRPRAAWLICFALIACGGTVVHSTSLAQQPPPPVATVLIETRVDAPTDAAMTLSAALLLLNPGQASLPVVNSGVLLLVVETGSVSLTTDRPIAGRTSEGDGTIGQYRLTTNQRVSVPSGATLQLRGVGDLPARLYVISLFPAAIEALSS